MSGSRPTLISPPLSIASPDHSGISSKTITMPPSVSFQAGPSPQPSPGFGPGYHHGMPAPPRMAPSERQSQTSVFSSSAYPMRTSSANTSFGPDGRQHTLASIDTFRRHYHALKAFLNVHPVGASLDGRPNRARDKLRRLQPIPFQELSTDVYDELLRRQDAMVNPSRTPPSLPPQQTFHVKRNQARQKLSTLPAERFNQLATDVFYELEQRHPMFVDGSSERSSSPAASVTSQRTMPPPMGPAGLHARGPHQSSGPAHGGPGYSHLHGPGRGPGGRPGIHADTTAAAYNGHHTYSPASAYSLTNSATSTDGPKLPAIHNDPIIPVTTTMVVVADDEVDSLSSLAGSVRSNKDGKYAAHQRADAAAQMADDHATELAAIRAEHEHMVASHQAQVALLEDKIASLELDVQRRENVVTELRRSAESEQFLLQTTIDQLNSDIVMLNERLEAADSQNVALEQQVAYLSTENESLAQNAARDNAAQNGTNEEIEELIGRYEALQDQYSHQKRITDEVKGEAKKLLDDLTTLSVRQTADIEREENLVQRNMDLERQVDDWKQRYANKKAQDGALRSSAVVRMDRSGETLASIRQSAFLSEHGLIGDVQITRFQIRLDGLLKAVRDDEPAAILDSVKQVGFVVRAITDEIDGPRSRDSAHSGDGQAMADDEKNRLRERVTGTANNLITATKNHVSSAGMAPISLVDAAASHLAMSVIELVKMAKLRPCRMDGYADGHVDNSVSSLTSGTVSTAASAASVATPRMRDDYGDIHNRVSVASSGYSVSSVTDYPWGDNPAGQKDGSTLIPARPDQESQQDART